MRGSKLTAKRSQLTKNATNLSADGVCALGGIRTPGLWNRNPTLYPTELQAREQAIYSSIRRGINRAAANLVQNDGYEAEATDASAAARILR
jgi:hypothetical protein